MPSTISPRPGFDSAKVKWGGPDQVRTAHCSYCGEKLDGCVPLILWTEDGSCAEFCDRCQAAWFDLRRMFPIVKSRTAYRDDSYPERDCDRCGKPYCGPAVYCSLECAAVDA